MSWASDTPQGVRLAIKVAPRSSRDGVGGVEGDMLKVRLTAPPVDGKANAALEAFLSKALGVPRRDVVILRGDTARMKSILVRGVTASSAEALLLSGGGGK